MRSTQVLVHKAVDPLALGRRQAPERTADVPYGQPCFTAWIAPPAKPVARRNANGDGTNCTDFGAGSFALVIYRLPLLKARNELDSWASREAAFMVNNWILLFAAMFVLFGTMFPTLSEAIRGERLTVAAPFFNKWMAPVGLVLLLLTGIGPLLAWRKSTLKNFRDQFIWPLAAALPLFANAALRMDHPFRRGCGPGLLSW